MSGATSQTGHNPTPEMPPWYSLGLLSKPNWRNAIAESNLPDDIQEVIRTVVKKSRLMRREKYDVAVDLISHFQDGANKGQTFSQIAEEFGDPVVTATLIRRSKLRSRSMFMKTFRGVGIGAGILSIAYLSIMAFFHLGSPNPKIDYLADMNSYLLDVEPEQKAWNLYRPVWTKYGFSEGGQCELKRDIMLEDENGESHVAHPLDEDWPIAVASLAKHEELLEVLRLGAKLPSFGLELKANPGDYSPEDFAALYPNQDRDTYCLVDETNPEAELLIQDSLIYVLLPHISPFREAARAFHVDTRLAVIQNDPERVVTNVETVIGLGRQAAEARLLVCSLVGYAVASIGFEQLEEVLTADPDFFSDEQLMRLQVAVEGAEIQEWLNFEGERANMKDIIQRIYTDDGNGDGRMTPVGLDVLQYCQALCVNESELDSQHYAVRKIVGPASLLMCASRKETTEKLDELIDQTVADAALPRWLSQGTDVEEVLDKNRYRYHALSFIFPASTQVRDAMDRTSGRKEAVIAALAIHRYFKKYGEWPSEYDQISPEFIAEFPVDVVDGSLLKFKYDDNELVVYSVGNDLDDDGGMARDESKDGTNEPGYFIFRDVEDARDCDWVLWSQKTDVVQ